MTKNKIHVDHDALEELIWHYDNPYKLTPIQELMEKKHRENFIDEIIHQEFYKKRMIFVKKVGFSKENTWFTGYLEILPTDPPIWKKKVEEMDYEYFTFQDFFDLEFGDCTFAGKLPYFKDHYMYIGFDTQEVRYPVTKNECIASLKKMADYLDRRLNHEDHKSTKV